MSESENKFNGLNMAEPRRKKFGPLRIVALLLWNFGIVFTTMKTVNHLKQQPPEPLGFDLTLRWGDGGFIAYGVAIAVLGSILLWIDARRRNSA